MSDKNKNEHIENAPDYKALKVNSGISKPPSINPRIADRLKMKKRKKHTVDDFVKGILDGNMAILSQAITLVESAKFEHQKIAQEIIERCLPHSGKSTRIGITGVPGAGKSTFIEAFGKHVTSMGHKLAVLAIDPSSERTKGSILGDKTRMEELAVDPHAYIRPSPSAGSLGGVARKTRESLILCEAAGFDTILIETVGVGQSETAVHSMVDFFLLIQIAGAGDELQGIKRGIMEMADAIAINKCDGSNVTKAQLARVQFENALHLFPLSPSQWSPKVLTCSSIEKKGVDDIWNTIMDYCKHTFENGYFDNRRSEQAKYWMYETINEQLRDNFYHDNVIKNMIPDFETKVLNDEMSSFIAAYKLLNTYYDQVKNKE
ncbi:methylmalonyl Co-A mutase-associated GTPase MeaB [Labilibaculum sp. DW002]|uniref:Methylmalonyl Co-A mutase-associated GTPase MeaB n=1 Tax=Paralabilibaculum antarcticum TaxID=2912572 RepID=A0ABT5VTF5_9BACT|nr:methylmalonyl Co-A mutase-associated GTPase MeaB [Labilibaculum sp. DW002]MDE5418688.1 methylmalonyl Co-A mutase-associated GTPase MeaB [Labilibaculum sp. DW002]